ncbi:hypothetical protein V8E54_003254 [Elaphomyces granulatus]
MDIDIDFDTAIATLNLQLQELKNLLQNGRAGATANKDLEFAINLQIDEYQRQVRTLIHQVQYGPATATATATATVTASQSPTTTTTINNNNNISTSSTQTQAMQLPTGNGGKLALSRLNDEERSSLQGRFSARRLALLAAKTLGKSIGRSGRSGRAGRASKAGRDHQGHSSSSSVFRRKLRSTSKKEKPPSSPPKTVKAEENKDKKKKTKKLPRPRPRTQACVSCMEAQPMRHVVQAPCSHHYCRDCISTLFDKSTSDVSLFPAQCCGQRIPISLVRKILTARLIRSLKEKEAEFAVPAAARIYCAHATCASFIGPKFYITGENVAVCPSCSKHTCSLCKTPAHGGSDCPKDLDLQKTLQMAKKAGWKRCYNCRAVVQRISGCPSVDVERISVTVVA